MLNQSNFRKIIKKTIQVDSQVGPVVSRNQVNQSRNLIHKSKQKSQNFNYYDNSKLSSITSINDGTSKASGHHKTSHYGKFPKSGYHQSKAPISAMNSVQVQKKQVIKTSKVKQLSLNQQDMTTLLGTEPNKISQDLDSTFGDVQFLRTNSGCKTTKCSDLTSAKKSKNNFEFSAQTLPTILTPSRGTPRDKSHTSSPKVEQSTTLLVGQKQRIKINNELSNALDNKKVQVVHSPEVRKIATRHKRGQTFMVGMYTPATKLISPITRSPRGQSNTKKNEKKISPLKPSSKICKQEQDEQIPNESQHGIIQIPSITNLNHPDVKMLDNGANEGEELQTEIEKLKTMNNMLNQKIRDQDLLINDLDFLKKKNHGLVRMIDQLRKEVQDLKADMSAKNLQIKSKDCCIMNLKTKFDKTAQEIEELRQKYINITHENYKSKMLFTQLEDIISETKLNSQRQMTKLDTGHNHFSQSLDLPPLQIRDSKNLQNHSEFIQRRIEQIEKIKSHFLDMQPDVAPVKNLFQKDSNGHYNFKLQKSEIKFDMDDKLYIEQNGERLKLNEFISHGHKTIPEKEQSFGKGPPKRPEFAARFKSQDFDALRCRLGDQ